MLYRVEGIAFIVLLAMVLVYASMLNPRTPEWMPWVLAALYLAVFVPLLVIFR